MDPKQSCFVAELNECRGNNHIIRSTCKLKQIFHHVNVTFTCLGFLQLSLKHTVFSNLQHHKCGITSVKHRTNRWMNLFSQIKQSHSLWHLMRWNWKGEIECGFILVILKAFAFFLQLYFIFMFIFHWHISIFLHLSIIHSILNWRVKTLLGSYHQISSKPKAQWENRSLTFVVLINPSRLFYVILSAVHDASFFQDHSTFLITTIKDLKCTDEGLGKVISAEIESTLNSDSCFLWKALT